MEPKGLRSGKEISDSLANRERLPINGHKRSPYRGSSFRKKRSVDREDEARSCGDEFSSCECDACEATSVAHV